MRLWVHRCIIVGGSGDGNGNSGSDRYVKWVDKYRWVEIGSDSNIVMVGVGSHIG